MRLSLLLFMLATFNLAPAAVAADLHVDATGAGGAYTTIGAAMGAASPGDRLLVQPGHYPAFQFWVAVDVIGLGNRPSDVRIDRVDFHVSVPVSGYDTCLSNVHVGSTAASDDLAIVGNELPPGTFHIDGVIVDGGVYLASGASGFYLLITNSIIRSEPGEGFLDSATFLAGSGMFAEIRNSTIEAPGAGTLDPADSGLTLSGGCSVRLVRATIRGGDGSAAAGFPDGADGIWQTFTPGLISLRLDGGSTIRGGAGEGSGAGGDGVDVTGAIRLGDATVEGGIGSPHGEAYARSLPESLPADLHLGLTPLLADAAGATSLGSGDTFTLSMNTPAQQTALVLSLDLDPPGAGLFLPLGFPPLTVIPGNSFQALVPAAPGGVPLPGIQLYAVGFTRVGGALLVSDTAAMRLDLLP